MSSSLPSSSRLPGIGTGPGSTSTSTSKSLACDSDLGGIQVIGAGFGRTGTSSFREALNILGYRTYHMTEVVQNGKKHVKFWEDFADGKKDLDFKEIFEEEEEVCESEIKSADESKVIKTRRDKYTATCDFPSARYWKEQLRQYPKAKVVLTKRSTTEAWYTSCVSTIFKMMNDSPFAPLGVKVAQSIGGLPVRGFASMTSKVLSRETFKNDYSKQNICEIYESWNQSVIEECPAENLLVFEPKDGWGPLCKFLGKDIPDVPYPHVNDTAEFNKLIRFSNCVGWSIIITPVLTIVAGTYLALKRR